MLSSQSQDQSDQGDKIFLAFKEWLKIQEARHGSVADHPYGNSSSDSDRNEFHVSPGIAPVEPSVGVNPSQASFQSPGISRGRLWVGRRVFRTFAYGVIIIVTVGAALAWDASDDRTKDIVRAWGISLIQLSSVLGAMSPAASDAAAEPVSKASEQALLAARSSPKAQHQLETMVSDLADLRRIVEQFAAKQEQMAQDVATLQAAKQNVSEKKSSLAQSSSAFPPPKNIHSEASVQPSSVPVPIPRPQIPSPLH
jgi:hypothetical protein